MAKYVTEGGKKLVTLIPGDGIGVEVTDAARRVVAAAGVPVQWDVQVAGAAARKVDEVGSAHPGGMGGGGSGGGDSSAFLPRSVTATDGTLGTGNGGTSGTGNDGTGELSRLIEEVRTALLGMGDARDAASADRSAMGDHRDAFAAIVASLDAHQRADAEAAIAAYRSAVDSLTKAVHDGGDHASAAQLARDAVARLQEGIAAAPTQLEATVP